MCVGSTLKRRQHLIQSGALLQTQADRQCLAVNLSPVSQFEAKRKVRFLVQMREEKVPLSHSVLAVETGKSC